MWYWNTTFHSAEEGRIYKSAVRFIESRTIMKPSRGDCNQLKDAASFWDLPEFTIDSWKGCSFSPQNILLYEWRYECCSSRFSIQMSSILDFTFKHQFRLDVQMVCKFEPRNGRIMRRDWNKTILQSFRTPPWNKDPYDVALFKSHGGRSNIENQLGESQMTPISGENDHKGRQRCVSDRAIQREFQIKDRGLGQKSRSTLGDIVQSKRQIYISWLAEHVIWKWNSIPNDHLLNSILWAEICKYKSLTWGKSLSGRSENQPAITAR